MRRRRRAGEKKKRKQETDFEEAVCCPSAVVQGAAQRKMKGSARGNWDPREGQQPFRPDSNGVGDCATTLRRLLIGADFISCNVDRIPGIVPSRALPRSPP